MSEVKYFIGQCHQCFSKFHCGTARFDDMRLLKLKEQEKNNQIKLVNKSCQDFWLCKDVGESGIRAI